MNYRILRARLDTVLAELESADSSDIDKLISLHAKSLEIITQLEKELTQAARQPKKSS